MVYAISADLLFPTATRRDNVLGVIEAQIAGRNRWGVTELRTVNDRVPSNRLRFEARFVSAADANATWTDLTGLSGQRVPDPGSTAMRHDCPHDEAQPGPCQILDTFSW